MKSHFSKISVLLASFVRIIAILNENDITQAFTQGLLLKPLGSLIFHLALQVEETYSPWRMKALQMIQFIARLHKKQRAIRRFKL
jgi:hypothetical protein